MTARQPAPPPLWRFSSERRRYERHALAARVRLHGPNGVVCAETVDVSASGVLLRIDLPHEIGLSPAEAGTPPIAALRTLFGTSFQLRFEDHEVSARARLVRVVRPRDDPHSLLVGCEFALNLHSRQLEKLGVELHACARRTETQTSSILPLDVRDDAPVEVHVRDLPGTLLARGAALPPVTAGDEPPLCAGRLVGLGGPVLAAKVDPEAPPRVAARLDGRRLSVRVVHDAEEIWAVAARLLSVRFVPSHPPTAEVALLVETEPPPEIAARFRRIPAA